MSCISEGRLWLAPQAQHSQGATEQIARRFMDVIPTQWHQPVQIHISKVTGPIDRTKPQILWQHDNHLDPMQHIHCHDWDRVVFVSQWQREQYRTHLGWRGPDTVIPNAIDDMAVGIKPQTPLTFVYASAPDRGLDVLTQVFDRLYYPDLDIRLIVFTAWSLYGGAVMDDLERAWRPYLDIIAQHPGIDFRGFEPDHAQVMRAKQQGHIWLYPTSWQENSCVSLIESLAAGMLCVHPRIGALSETAQGRSIQYDWVPDRMAHADLAHSIMRDIVDQWRATGTLPHMPGIRHLPCHTWSHFRASWIQLLGSLTVPRYAQE